MSKRYYVGLIRGTLRRVVFAAAAVPTAADYPQYSSCVGPFRRKLDAQIRAQFPSSNHGSATQPRKEDDATS